MQYRPIVLFSAIACLPLALALTGCGGGSSIPRPIPTPVPTMAPSVTTNIRLGEQDARLTFALGARTGPLQQVTVQLNVLAPASPGRARSAQAALPLIPPGIYTLTGMIDVSTRAFSLAGTVQGVSNGAAINGTLTIVGFVPSATVAGNYEARFSGTINGFPTEIGPFSGPLPAGSLDLGL